MARSVSQSARLALKPAQQSIMELYAWSFAQLITLIMIEYAIRVILVALIVEAQVNTNVLVAIKHYSWILKVRVFLNVSRLYHMETP